MKSGNKVVDKLLPKGIAEGSLILVEGPPGIGKRVFGYNFILNSIKNNNNCFYLYAGRSHKEIFNESEMYGINLKKFDSKIDWIDCSKLSEGKNAYHCDMSKISDLSTLLHTIIKKNKKVNGVIEIISPLIINNSIKIIYNFLFDIKKRVKRKKSIVMVLIEYGMHPQTEITALEDLADFVIDLRLIGNKLNYQKYCHIKKAIGPVNNDNVKFNLTEKGIIIL
tara:strand:- start:1173 stop:1841 length:669 start_codon:yes stop_codon:yes gene_type:complete